MSLPSKLLALLIALIVSAGAGYRAGVKLTQANQNDATIAAIETARTEEKQNAQRVQTAQSSQLKAVIKKAADTAAVTIERDSLRDQVRAFAGGAETIATANQRAATLGELFNSCTAEYQAVGSAAQGHALDVKTLIEAWPR